MSRIIAINAHHTLVNQVKACRQGDESAMQWLFQQFASRMLGVCRRYLYRIDLAEEAMSSGFARAFDHIASLREDEKFEGWLKSIVVRECLDMLRKEKRYRFDEEISGVADDDISTFPDASHSYDTEVLLKIIDELPPGYRMVFNLYAIEGYTHQEIGNLLGISDSTSKTQYKKARAAIQIRFAQGQQKEKSYGSC